MPPDQILYTGKLDSSSRGIFWRNKKRWWPGSREVRSTKGSNQHSVSALPGDVCSHGEEMMSKYIGSKQAGKINSDVKCHLCEAWPCSRILCWPIAHLSALWSPNTTLAWCIHLQCSLKSGYLLNRSWLKHAQIMLSHPSHGVAFTLYLRHSRLVASTISPFKENGTTDRKLSPPLTQLLQLGNSIPTIPEWLTPTEIIWLLKSEGDWPQSMWSSETVHNLTLIKEPTVPFWQFGVFIRRTFFYTHFRCILYYGDKGNILLCVDLRAKSVHHEILILSVKRSYLLVIIMSPGGKKSYTFRDVIAKWGHCAIFLWCNKHHFINI